MCHIRIEPNVTEGRRALGETVKGTYSPRGLGSIPIFCVETVARGIVSISVCLISPYQCHVILKTDNDFKLRP
jgi:hypothetical protein